MSEQTAENSKSNRLDFWDGLSIFSIGLFELSALYFAWHLAFTFHDDPIVAIIAATFTVVVVLIDCTAILNNRLNDMVFEAKHFMPDLKYKLDNIHSTAEETNLRSIKMKENTDWINNIVMDGETLRRVLAINSSLENQNEENQTQIHILTVANKALSTQVQQLEAALKQQSPITPNKEHPNQ